MKNQNIKIINLNQRLEFLEQVSFWLWIEFGQKEGQTLEFVKYQIAHCLFDDRVPQTFIALHEDKLVGTVSLWSNDLTARQDLFPWMANLFVDEKFRSLGIGTQLQKYAVKQAKFLGYDKLYIYTNLDNYYEKSGWNFIEFTFDNNCEQTKIYEYLLKQK